MSGGNRGHAHGAGTIGAGRRGHYADFYGPVPGGRTRPLALVHGNCQAESVRMMLGAPLATVRVPPVHELLADDVPHLARWLAAADVLVCQPIRAGYRGLPLGTADVLAAAGPRTRLVLVPIIRDLALYPEQAIIRPAHDPAATPPSVAYHSLRVLAEAAGRRLPALTPAAVSAVTRHGLAELRRRESAHGTIVVSDRLARPSYALMRTINHPGNDLISTLVERIHSGLGLDDPPSDPGRPLLDAVHSPREPAVIEAHGLPDAPDPDWRVNGRRIRADTVRAAHLAWYAAHPDAVQGGLRRHAETLTLLDDA